MIGKLFVPLGIGVWQERERSDIVAHRRGCGKWRKVQRPEGAPPPPPRPDGLSILSGGQKRASIVGYARKNDDARKRLYRGPDLLWHLSPGARVQGDFRADEHRAAAALTAFRPLPNYPGLNVEMALSLSFSKKLKISQTSSSDESLFTVGNKILFSFSFVHFLFFFYNEIYLYAYIYVRIIAKSSSFPKLALAHRGYNKINCV